MAIRESEKIFVWEEVKTTAMSITSRKAAAIVAIFFISKEPSLSSLTFSRQEKKI
jgi:hypothetical protein